MINDDAKKSLLEWLFGKAALDKAAQTGNPTPAKPINPSIEPQTTDYVKEQIKKDEEIRKQREKQLKPKQIKPPINKLTGGY